MTKLRIEILGALCWTIGVAALGCGNGAPVSRGGGGAGPTSQGGSGASAPSHGGDGGGGADTTGVGGFGGLGGGGPVACDGPGARFVTRVVELAYGPGQDHGRNAMPDVVFGPPLGGGTLQGSLDVVSLGNGGVITVAFDGNAIVDGPGPDFIVFENPFETAGGVFAELATVAVSDDGHSWHSFPCDATEAPYGTCAGHTPVLANGDLGPLEPESAGGDAFDLAALGLTQARYVRITDRADLDGLDGVFDLDAVGIVNAACP